eukprot:775651-Pelagomonas_calceolata.AAC.5
MGADAHIASSPLGRHKDHLWVQVFWNSSCFRAHYHEAHIDGFKCDSVHTLCLAPPKLRMPEGDRTASLSVHHMLEGSRAHGAALRKPEWGGNVPLTAQHMLEGSRAHGAVLCNPECSGNLPLSAQHMLEWSGTPGQDVQGSALKAEGGRAMCPLSAPMLQQKKGSWGSLSATHSWLASGLLSSGEGSPCACVST